ncbi:hypothetical protein DF3PA_240001 [Candidatus Defluviicoccus seviourii]|uniref:Uncharacterized protein n=1 Tax=Candidatus Defluviicoccus seviourii TaxID=2565273 RepID=A0A564WDK7_9PROT|nr:hypothetical protein DF3PA_240001 [Candidatus Defluviicoccus seviourii]
MVAQAGPGMRRILDDELVSPGATVKDVGAVTAVTGPDLIVARPAEDGVYGIGAIVLGLNFDFCHLSYFFYYFSVLIFIWLTISIIIRG